MYQSIAFNKFLTFFLIAFFSFLQGEVSWDKPKVFGCYDLSPKDEYRILRDDQGFPYYYNPFSMDMTWSPPPNHSMCEQQVHLTWWPIHPTPIGKCEYFSTRCTSDGKRFCEKCWTNVKPSNEQLYAFAIQYHVNVSVNDKRILCSTTTFYDASAVCRIDTSALNESVKCLIDEYNRIGNCDTFSVLFSRYGTIFASVVLIHEKVSQNRSYFQQTFLG